MIFKAAWLSDVSGLYYLCGSNAGEFHPSLSPVQTIIFAFYGIEHCRVASLSIFTVAVNNPTFSDRIPYAGHQEDEVGAKIATIGGYGNIFVSESFGESQD